MHSPCKMTLSAPVGESLSPAKTGSAFYRLLQYLGRYPFRPSLLLAFFLFCFHPKDCASVDFPRASRRHNHTRNSFLSLCEIVILDNLCGVVHRASFESIGDVKLYFLLLFPSHLHALTTFLWPLIPCQSAMLPPPPFTASSQTDNTTLNLFPSSQLRAGSFPYLDILSILVRLGLRYERQRLSLHIHQGPRGSAAACSSTPSIYYGLCHLLPRSLGPV